MDKRFWMVALLIVGSILIGGCGCSCFGPNDKLTWVTGDGVDVQGIGNITSVEDPIGIKSGTGLKTKSDPAGAWIEFGANTWIDMEPDTRITTRPSGGALYSHWEGVTYLYSLDPEPKTIDIPNYGPVDLDDMKIRIRLVSGGVQVGQTIFVNPVQIAVFEGRATFVKPSGERITIEAWEELIVERGGEQTESRDADLNPEEEDIFNNLDP